MLSMQVFVHICTQARHLPLLMLSKHKRQPACGWQDVPTLHLCLRESGSQMSAGAPKAAAHIKNAFWLLGARPLQHFIGEVQLGSLEIFLLVAPPPLLICSRDLISPPLAVMSILSSTAAGTDFVQGLSTMS